MIRLISSIIFILLVSMSLVISASTESDKNSGDTEIKYLLNFIGQSNCIFIRNNEEHKAQQAREHIERKYHYYIDKVNSAEDFIKYAATKSSFSGKQYMARCNEKTKPSSQWLLDELSAYRRQYSASK